MCLLSVIVPVYNVEKYVKTCISSVINQTFKDFELIIVNDGSTDSSMHIINELLFDFPNAHTIDQVNQGVSVARNNGILKATGDYLVFIDSDDYLKTNSDFEKLAHEIKNNNFPDLILHEETRLFNKDVFHYENNIMNVENKISNNFKNDLAVLIYNEILVASPWDKVIKREIMIKNQIFFPIGLKSEDMIWVHKLLPFINSYICLDFSFYIYRKNVSSSSTKTVSEKHMFDIVEMIKQALSDDVKIDKKAINAYWSEHYTFLLMNADVVKSNKKNFWDFLETYKFLLQKNNTKNVDRVYKFYKFFGLKFTSFLLIQFRKVNNFNRKYQFIHE